MNDHPTSQSFSLEPADNQRLASLCGQFNEHLRQIESRLGVEINNRGNSITVTGNSGSVNAAESVLKKLYEDTGDTKLKGELTTAYVHLLLQEETSHGGHDQDSENGLHDVAIATRHGLIKGRGVNQKRYLQNVITHDISFGIGPAGTGKTYLAVACAVEALEKKTVQRILLVRPAVEAGERLGFLPGDLAQKVDPYLRPLYDALYEMMGLERVDNLIERNFIEIAPLAYMRGRSLNDSFIILDEAQNTTVEQMKMFLTRIGFGSTAVITGDVTQIDLPQNTRSGLRHAIDVLKNVEGIGFTFFQSCDVVRHPLVKLVVDAYEEYEQKNDN